MKISKDNITNNNNNNKMMSKPVETIDTLVGSGSILQGNLEFTGGLRVDGNVKGDISAHDNNNGTLVLSESGLIEGNINVPHVVINGVVKGNIKSSGRIELQSNARVSGDVHYKAVEMELGAVLNGNLVADVPATDAYNLISGGAASGDTVHGSDKKQEKLEKSTVL